MGATLETRRRDTKRRTDDLCARLTKAQGIAQGKCTVFATGSFGRVEASTHSDLDIFIVGRTDEEKKRVLSRLDEICLKAELIEVARSLGFKPFSRDGEFLKHLSIDDLVSHLGKPEDDAENTFTARLLLLLESKPLIESKIRSEALDAVIAGYWRDFEEYTTSFVPAFLANDILRLWRTFCVNYEAFTEKDPPEKRAKRRLTNYKLKNSRLLTCYSALLFLLAKHLQKKTVEPPDALEMAELTPTQRLEWLGREFSSVKGRVDEALAAYETFLQETDRSEEDLLKLLADPETKAKLRQQDHRLGNAVFDLLHDLGNDSELYRIIVV